LKTGFDGWDARGPRGETNARKKEKDAKEYPLFYFLIHTLADGKKKFM